MHVFVLFLYPAITVRFGEMDPTIDPTAPSSVEGMEIVNLQAFESDEIDAPAEPEAELNPPPVALTVPTSFAARRGSAARRPAGAAGVGAHRRRSTAPRDL